MKQIKNRWRATQWVVIALVWWGTTATAEEMAMAPESVDSLGASSIDSVQETPTVAETPLAEGTTAIHTTSAPMSFTLDSDEVAEESVWGIAVRLGFGLSLVVLLAWGAAYLLKKSALGRQLGSDSGAIRIVERAYLAPKKAIYLVEIGGRALALGVTETNIAPLSQWEAGEIELKPRDATPSPFAAQLKNILGQKPRGEK